MKNTVKNIAAILFHIWIMPFEVAIVIISVIGGLPIILLKGDKVLTFYRNQKQWKVTKLLEKINDFFEIITVQ